MILANEVPEDQRQAQYRRSPQPQVSGAVKRSRRHRKSRATNSGGTPRSEGSSHSPRKEHPISPRAVRQETSSSLSHGSHRSQLVDLVVEDQKAEEAEREHAQKAFGSTWLEPEQRHFQYDSTSIPRKLNGTRVTFQSRRPSGEPVDERPSYLQDSAGASGEGAEPASQTERGDDDEPATRQNWTYGELEEDNVWDR